MSENPGGPTPPRDDDPSVPPPPPAYGQPAGGVPPTPPPPGSGAYPPPAYGTPADPSGGAYPPPASPYGQPGQPYGQPGQPYGQPYTPPAGQVDIGAGFSWAFSKFGQHWAAFVLGGLAWFAVIAVVFAIGLGIVGGAAALTGDSSAGGFGATLGLAVFFAIILLLLVLFSAAFVKAALKVADGRPISVGDLFDTSHAGQLVVLALLYGAAGLVASLIPFIGQIALIAVGFFAFYAVVSIIDRNLGAIDAIRTSFSLQTRDLGTGILVYVVVGLVSWVGSLVCGVGVLVSLPVGALLTVYAYRRLTGGQIAA
ncbi:conserved hypothetical protein [Cellulomonas flavigena DSM 20109]|uniref:Integral membrane protein n=1 Tax=Cellulomonas flavigena (strain ATCC 482 / DSM 20109 / BCRC 11376 / JCM 18109 / NBRC 3775 / NCIMB 8073 / NRS 134) TaxID=446466 RepID=D5UGK5_CELFN|nr:hypothetical protein [Cellulomonas flavigena]ADG75103.1 conserved hypothetical protein [Cellulomonas flavigena DSM 20109]